MIDNFNSSRFEEPDVLNKGEKKIDYKLWILKKNTSKRISKWLKKIEICIH